MLSALFLITVFLVAVYKIYFNNTVTYKKVTKYGENKTVVLKEAPGPTPLPIIGNLHLLGKHESPFQSFTDLAKEYGDIFSLKMGTTKCLVVNNLDLIREVLNQNGKFFGGRPDFIRFHQLFAGDRNNCDRKFESKEDASLILKTLSRAVEVDIQDCDIKDIYRIQTNKEGSKPIMVELNSVVKKEKILQGVKNYNKKKPNEEKLNTGHLSIAGPVKPVFISEALTPNTQKLFYAARQFARENGYTYCWTSRGSIFLRKAEALALCDWSNLQLRRRNLARRHCGPKQHTDNFARIGDVATFESIELMQTLKGITRTSDASINLKPILMTTAMNMFCHYMCNVRFDADTDQDFKRIVDHFDEIFWEINQGYALDFLPWLSPFYKKHLDKLSNWSADIRSFILSRIVEQRELNLDMEGPEKDFLDGLLKVLHEDPTVDRNTIIFMLEDFLGGHSSVGNLVMLCLTAVARDPEVGRKIRAELDSLTKGKRPVTLLDRQSLPYTEATVLECLRYASSPIVPHVATENAAISGYGVEKGTIVFINNYELNTSEEYWNEPEKFDPTRFLEKTKIRVRRNSLCDSGMESDGERSTATKHADAEKEVWSVRRNIPHFLPFSIGKRTCIGQTLVTTMSFVMFASIMQEFEIGAENLEDLRQKPACVALPKDTYNLYLMPRKH